LGSKGLLNYKTVLILLFAVILNMTVFVLLWQLDTFVNSEPYNYGLVFSYDWGESYWYYNQLLWTFLVGATALTACAVIPHYLHSRKVSGFSKLFGFLLPTVALVYQVLSIFFLSQLDSIVRYTLYQYGLSVSFDWSVNYDPVFKAIFALMATSLVPLIISAVRTLDIVKFKQEQEAD